MKLHAILTLVAAAAFAGPAFAEGGFGSFKKAPATPTWPALPGQPKPAPSLVAPPAPTPGFKPYEPYKGSSVYAAPKPASGGAKDCQLSVYVNACAKR